MRSAMQRYNSLADRIRRAADFAWSTPVYLWGCEELRTALNATVLITKHRDTYSPKIGLLAIVIQNRIWEYRNLPERATFGLEYLWALRSSLHALETLCRAAAFLADADEAAWSDQNRRARILE